MERLTMRMPNGKGTCLNAPSGCTCGEGCGWIDDVFTKLAEYENLEEQGLLLRLPCKVGDTVYHFMNIDDVVTVCEHRFATLTNIVAMLENGSFGRDVFLTKEEAEQKLASMQKGE